MFKKKSARKKFQGKNFTPLSIVITPKLLQILEFSASSPPSTVLSDEQMASLEEYLRVVTTDSELKLKLLNALETLQKRTLQLAETKDVVANLRESEETSTEALSFLKEKLDLLIKEREELISKIKVLQEELVALPFDDYLERILAFIEALTFAETNSWEEQLDYYRTRFLMQKDKDTRETPLEQKITVREALEQQTRDPLSTVKISRLTKSSKPSLSILLPKKATNLLSLVESYNRIVTALPKEPDEALLELKGVALKTRLAKIEEESLTIGRELYTLKREQGILSLKTYELIQTLKVRLFNISGAIASRSFLKSGLDELIKTVRNRDLSLEGKKQLIRQELQRLLRILGEIPTTGK